MQRLVRVLVASTALLLAAAGCAGSDSSDPVADDITTTTAAADDTAAGADPDDDTATTTTAEADDGDDGASGDASAAVATVDGVDITAADLAEETTLAREFAEANPGQADALANSDDPQIRADLAASLVIDQILRTYLGDNGGEVSEEQRATVVDSLPPNLVSTTWLDRFVDRQTRFLAFGASVAVANGLAATPEEWFAENPDALGDIACSRHVLVETEAEAIDVRDRIVDGGEDFGAVAQDASTGPSGPNGGDLGCDDPAGFVEAFADAVRTLPLNEVSDPVETEFGWHVIEVTARGADAIEATELDGRIADLYDAEVSELSSDAFTDVISAADVTVSPDLGTWDPAIGTIIPPES